MNAIRFAVLMMIASVACADETARIDGVIVTTGMSVGEIIKRAGQPDAREDVQNAYGAVLGSRWEYYGQTRMVTLWIQHGEVVRIDDE